MHIRRSAQRAAAATIVTTIALAVAACGDSSNGNGYGTSATSTSTPAKAAATSIAVAPSAPAVPSTLTLTSDAFTTMLHRHGVAISMDGRGCWHDNVFVERLWRSIKYEEVYLHAYEGASAAKAGIGRYLDFYNRRRPHTALGERTPDEAYFTQQPLVNAA